MFFESSFFNNFDQKKKAELIRNIQSLMRCPNCGASYNASDISLLGQIDSVWVVHLDCPKCNAPVLSTVIVQEKEGRPTVSSRTKGWGKQSKITSDEVLDFHQFLEKFDGDFEKAINED